MQAAEARVLRQRDAARAGRRTASRSRSSDSPAHSRISGSSSSTAAGGKPQDILGAWQYEPGNIEWLNDGQIAMTTSTGGSRGLYKIDPDTKKITTILGGRRQVNGPIVRRAQTAHRLRRDATSRIRRSSTSRTPTARNERKLTSFNDKLNAEVAWSDAERFTYKSVGGLEIEGWLMKPYGYEPAKKYPLVLYIHGGPHSAYGEGWFDEFQSLAGARLLRAVHESARIERHERGRSRTRAAAIGAARTTTIS